MKQQRSLNGPVVGSVFKYDQMSGMKIVAKLYATPEGLMWDDPTDAYREEKKKAEEGVKEVFKDSLDKLHLYQAHIFFDTYHKDPDKGIGYSVATNQLYRYIQPSEINPNTISAVEEDKWWSNQALFMGRDVFMLDGWQRLVKHYGTYRSGMTFLVNNFTDFEWIKDPQISAKMNLNFDGDCKLIYGEYFESKKGTKCFRVKKGGKHVLVKVSWGGSWNRSRGLRTAPAGSLYYRRTTSRGGGLGTDYVIFPANYKVSYSINDI